MKAAPEDLAGGSIYPDYSTSSRISHARRRLAGFYTARRNAALNKGDARSVPGNGAGHESREIAAERARSKARADGAPVRPAGVDEHLRLIDEGCALPDAGEVGND